MRAFTSLLMLSYAFASYAGTTKLFDSPPQGSYESCLQGKVAFSLAQQGGPVDEDQGATPLCYAYAYTMYMQMYVSRVTGQFHRFSPEFTACKSVRKYESAQFDQAPKEDEKPSIDGGNPINLIRDLKDGEALLAENNAKLSKQLKSFYSDLSSQAKNGKLKSSQEMCKKVDGKLTECSPKLIPGDVFKTLNVEEPPISDWREQMNTHREIRDLAAIGPNPFKNHPELREKCSRDSALLRASILRKLCLGIPALAEYTSYGIIYTSKGPSGKTSLNKRKPHHVGRHATPIVGVNLKGPGGEPAFILRNSWGPDASYVQMPFAEACRFYDLAWATSSEDRARTADSIWGPIASETPSSVKNSDEH